MRSITVAGPKYRYTVGRQTTVVRREDNTVLGKVGNHTLVGLTPSDFERGKRKKTSDGMVTPKHIAKAIRELTSC